MISIIYISNRGPYPMLNPPWKELSQYALLSQSLEAQTFTDFELIIVDAYNTLPSHELHWMEHRTKYLRPKDTPWRRLGAFAPSSARNTGLAAAKGELAFGLDDCTSFRADLLQKASDSWVKGKCLAPNCVRETGERVALPQGNRRGGVLFYPRELAEKLGGYEERFDGSPALEDWEFSERLSNNGVVWNDDQEAKVTLHAHKPHSGAPAAEVGPAGYHKCPYCVFRLVMGQYRANVDWTKRQLAAFESPACTQMVNKQCRAQRDTYLGSKMRTEFNCCWPGRPTVEALNIIRTHEAHIEVSDG